MAEELDWLEEMDRGVAPPPLPDHKEHRVIGPPGTGKTHYLSVQVPRAVDMYTSHGVMIASLTKAAAQEVGGRVDLPRGATGTLHAHAFRALERPEIAESSKGIHAWNDWLTSHGERQSYRMDPSTGADIEWAAPEQSAGGATEGSELLALLSVFRARMTPRELWPPKIEAFAERWARFKDDTNTYDFTDLIERAINEVTIAPGSPDVIMFDEAQDSSRLEFTLLRQWGDRARQLVVVGDPRQNLYEWRGSDPKAFFAAEAESEIVLSKSRRVPAAVHRYSVDWINRSPDELPDFSYEPRFVNVFDENSGIHEGAVEKCGHTWNAPEGLIARILKDLNETVVDYRVDSDGQIVKYERGRTVMVLASCGYMLDPMLRQLKERGVPFGNPYRPQHGGWNPLRGTERLQTFLRPNREVWGDAARMWNWKDVDKWMDPMKAKDMLTRGSKTLVKSKTMTGKFDDDDKMPAIDMDVLAKMFVNEADAFKCVDTDVDWWVSTLRDDKRRQVRYGATIFTKHGGRALREVPRLIVGTIHSVKGGQADTVYVFPDLSQRAWETGWFSQVDRAPIYRQFYVAFTRARDRLILCASSGAAYAQFPTPTGAP